MPGSTQLAQSPMAKMLSSRVVCNVGFTTRRLILSVSSPSISCRKSGALMPAAQTMSSAGTTSPEASTTSPCRTAMTRVPVRILTSSPRSTSVIAAASSSGGAGADDGDVQLPRPQRLILCIGAQAGVDHAAVEARRLIERVERDGIVVDPGRAEIVRHAADGNDERIVTEHARRNDGLAVLVDARRDVNLPLGAIEPDHRADAVAIVAQPRVGDQLQRIRLAVHRARRDFVQ